MHERDPRAVLRLVQVVGGHDHRDPLPRHRVDQPPEPPAGDRVHPAGRLVEEHEFRPVQHRAGEGEPLLEAAGKGTGQQVFLPFEPGHRDRGRRALRGHLSREAVHAAEEPQVLSHREIVVEAEPLRHVADPPLHPLRVLSDVDPEHRGDACAGRQQPHEHPDRGGFSGAIAAEEAEHLPCLHVERETVHGGERAETPREPTNFERTGHRYLPAARSRLASATLSRASIAVRSSPARSRPASASRSSDERPTPSL